MRITISLLQVFINYAKSSSDFDNIFLRISAKATYAAIAKTYAYLTPDLWKETVFTKSPYQEFPKWQKLQFRRFGRKPQPLM